MDKRQKELAKSYFHARQIATEGRERGFERYEITEDIILMGLIDISSMSEDQLDWHRRLFKQLFNNHPEFMLNKLNNTDVYHHFLAHIVTVEYLIDYIRKNPELIKLINKTSFPDDDSYIPSILFRRLPEHLEYFDLNDLTWVDIAEFIMAHPEKTDYFDLNIFNGEAIAYILDEEPELIKYFKKRLGEIDDLDKMHLLLQQPQLKKYFK